MYAFQDISFPGVSAFQIALQVNSSTQHPVPAKTALFTAKPALH